MATQWEESIAVGEEAYRQGCYTEAERLFFSAPKEAKGLSQQGPRLATTLNNLVGLYLKQGKYEEAEPLYQRALAIDEKALGPEYPDTASIRENYADLLRKTERR